MDDLPPGYRMIFVLHDVEGYEHNEIAEMAGCSIGNSKSQLHKARMKLRDLLKMNRAEKAGKSAGRLGSIRDRKQHQADEGRKRSGGLVAAADLGRSL